MDKFSFSASDGVMSFMHPSLRHDEVLIRFVDYEALAADLAGAIQAGGDVAKRCAQAWDENAKLHERIAALDSALADARLRIDRDEERIAALELHLRRADDIEHSISAEDWYKERDALLNPASETPSTNSVSVGSKSESADDLTLKVQNPVIDGYVSTRPDPLETRTEHHVVIREGTFKKNWNEAPTGPKATAATIANGATRSNPTTPRSCARGTSSK